MSEFKVILPSMGEGVTDATITKWLVKQGDAVNEDSPLVEVATDKVDSEIPSPKTGVVEKLLFNEGDVVPIGVSVLILKINDSEINSEIIEESPIQKFSTVAILADNNEQTYVNDEIKKSESKMFLSPLVRQMMKEYLISEEEISNVTGSGISGRITKIDVENYINTKAKQKEIIVNNEIKVEKEEPVIQRTFTKSSGNFEVIEMDRMRKIIAGNMVNSVHTSPHVTSFIEVDVTRIVEWRNKHKEEFLKKHDEKLTFMPIFIEATASTIRDYPLVNVSVEGNNILVKKNINIGIATALPSWNLIVPVIKNADQMNLIGLTKSLNDLANRARQSKLLPEEIKGGTFTITNLGSFGTLAGTPIINQPEAAILALGEIRKKPAVVETINGDAIAIRSMIIISLTFDHRIIDGALAGAFLKKLSERIENYS